MRRVAQMIKNPLGGVLNAIVLRVTNARAESSGSDDAPRKRPPALERGERGGGNVLSLRAVREDPIDRSLQEQ